MSVISVLEQRLCEFVVAQSPATAVERARLKAFVAVRLGFSAFLLLAAPAWLLAVAPPPAWQCIGFAFLLAPLGAVLALSRGFGLDFAQMVSVAGVLGFAATLAACGPEYSALSFAVLLLAVLEAAASGAQRLLVATCIAAFGIGALALIGAGEQPLAPTQFAVAGVLAAIVGYACALGWAMAYANAVASFGERRETLRHEALAQTIGDLVVRQDRDGSVVHASNEALTLFGIQPRDLIGRGLFERVHVADRPAFLTAVADALQTDKTVTTMVRLRRGPVGADDRSEQGFACIACPRSDAPATRMTGPPW